MQNWLSNYDLAARGYSVCHLLDEFGDAQPLPQAQFIADWHELQTRAGEQLPLA